MIINNKTGNYLKSYSNKHRWVLKDWMDELKYNNPEQEVSNQFTKYACLLLQIL